MSDGRRLLRTKTVLKPRAEPKLKVTVELEQAVRILSAMSRAYNKAGG